VGTGWYGPSIPGCAHWLIALTQDQAGLDKYLQNRVVDACILPGNRPTDDDMPSGSRYGPPQLFSISTRLEWGCAAPHCLRTKDLNRCPTCKTVSYCSYEHRYTHRPGHRSVCSKVKKAETNLEKEDRALRRSEGDIIFEGGWSEFWGIPESREYMRARVALVEALLRANTAQAVASSLDHLLDMLHLCRIDPMGARDVVPALYLRLGCDQKAYDFCKWWAVIGHDSNHNWGDLNAPYIDTNGADAFEESDLFTGNRLHLSHVVAIALLKIRLLIDLQSLQRAKEIAGPHVPREILDTIQRYCTNSAITSNIKIIEKDDQTPCIANLREQVKELYVAVKKANSHFWPAIIEPADNLKARPISYGNGDRGQMQVVLQHNYNAWAETPGAIGVIEALSKHTFRASPEA
jgi:hypothetical protein